MLSSEQIRDVLSSHALSLKGAMRTQLHPHQSRFLLWAMLREHVSCYGVRGGGNFMEMGCGKTLCMLMLVLFSRLWKEAGHVKDVGRALEWCQRIRQWPCIPCSRTGVRASVSCTLVICSKSAQAAWISEIRQHFGAGPSAPRYTDSDTMRYSLKSVNGDWDTLRGMLREYDIVFATSDMVQQVRANGAPREGHEEEVETARGKTAISIHDLLYGVIWERLIVDEAHQFASAKATTVSAIAEIRAQNRWIMTGTPMKNDLGGIAAIYIMMGVKHPLLAASAGVADPNVARATGVLCAELGIVLTMRRPRGAPDSFIVAQEYDPVTWMKHAWLCYLPAVPCDIVATVTRRLSSSALAHVEGLLQQQQQQPPPPSLLNTAAVSPFFESLWRERLRQLYQSSSGRLALSNDYDRVLLDEWELLQQYAWADFWTRMHDLAAAYQRIIAPFCSNGVFPPRAPLPSTEPRYTPATRVVYVMRGKPSAPHASEVPKTAEWYLRDALRLIEKERCANQAGEHGSSADSKTPGRDKILDTSGGSIVTYLLLKAASLHPELVDATSRRELLAAIDAYPDLLAEHGKVLSAYYSTSKEAPYLTAYRRCVSRKMEIFRDYLKYAVREDEKVVVFDKSVNALMTFFGYAKDALGYASMLISADVVPAPEDRMSNVRKFLKDPPSSSKILFITTALGAEAYNELVRANHCIMLAPWFDVAVEDQAFSRIDRPRQTRPVFRVILDFSDDSVGDDSDRLYLSLSKSYAAAAICGVPEFARTLVVYEEDIRDFRVYAEAYRHVSPLVAADAAAAPAFASTGGRLAQRKRIIDHQFRDTFVVPTHVPLLPGIGYVYLPRVSSS